MGEATENPSALVIRRGTALEMVSSIDEAVAKLEALQQFVKRVMHEGIDRDYGTIPGTNKRTLLKPGAEKLCEIYGLHATYEDLEIVKDWERGFFYFHKKCILWRCEHRVGEASASCNSRESKYAGRWVGAAELPPDVDRAKLRSKRGARWVFRSDLRDLNVSEKGLESRPFTSKGGKPYLKFKIEDVLYFQPNPDIFDQVNTMEKIAAKRALVSATISVTRSSDLFVPDMEDVQENAQAAGKAPEAPDDIPDAEFWSDGAPEPAAAAASPPKRGPVDIMADLRDAKTLARIAELAREANPMRVTPPELAALKDAFAAARARVSTPARGPTASTVDAKASDGTTSPTGESPHQAEASASSPATTGRKGKS